MSESGKITSVEINYNNTPFKVPEDAGVVIGHHYEKEVARILKRSLRENQDKACQRMLRMTLITTRPINRLDKLASFLLPPESCGNVNPIRVLQLTFHVDACPRGTYLIML